MAAALARQGPGARAVLAATAIIAVVGAAIGTIAVMNASRRPAPVARADPSRASAEEAGATWSVPPLPPEAPTSSPAAAAMADPLPAEAARAGDASPPLESPGPAISPRVAAPPSPSMPTPRTSTPARRPAALPAQRPSTSSRGRSSVPAPARSAGARPAVAAAARPAPAASSPSAVISPPPAPPPPATGGGSGPAPSQALAAAGSFPPQAAAPPSSAPVKTAAVATVRIVHSLEEGELSIWSDDRLLLKEPLRAVEMSVEALGTDLFDYRKERAEWLIQIPAGRRSLKVRVESVREGLSLVKETTQQVDADGRYSFEIRVRSFPRPHLALDWEAP